jgi:NADP-dependent 3-hydroxy acid dehydrogenase YdfG
MLDLKDHVVLVTGAGAGIGFGIARAFHEAGARVALGDLRETAVARAATKLGDSTRVYARAVDTGEVLAVNGGSSAGRAFLPLSTPSSA